MRFDYPGIGISPIARPLPREKLQRATNEAVEWFAKASGADRLSIAGICLGGILGLRAALEAGAVDTVAVVSLPVRRRRPIPAPARARLAAVDPVARVLGPVLTSGARSRASSNDWIGGLPAQIDAVAGRASLRFVNGERDEYHGDLMDLLAAGVVSPEARRRIEVVVLPDARLHMTASAAAHAWLGDTLVELLHVSD